MTSRSTTTLHTVLVVGVMLSLATGFAPAANIMTTQRQTPVMEAPAATVTLMHRGRQDTFNSSWSWGFFGGQQQQWSEPTSRRNVQKGPSADYDPPSTHEKDNDHSESRENDKTSDAQSVLSKRRGYQRVEEWDAEQKTAAQQLTWEQRVQFDGQRHGNGFKQNVILQQQLGKF